MFPLILFIFMSLFPSLLALPQRLCQVQGTCLDCGLGHFSHFLCRSSRDCFAGEHCVPSRGFCCPLPWHNPPEAAADRPNRPTAAEERCPADGGAWGRMCKRDADCLFRDELCAEGKCCPTCRQRRVQVLREATSAGGEWADRPSGLHIPQCTDDGKFHRPMQCAGGANECYCVDKYGRNISPKEEKAQGMLNCSRLREEEEEEGKRKKEKGQERVVALISRDPIRTDPSSAFVSSDAEEHCADPLRVFRRCGSACPISCATRTAPRCPQEQCFRGCFCRLPYVILDTADPYGSRCVLPAECPLLPFTAELDSWSGGFFPAAIHSAKRAEQCADPLKNFQNCGSACPVGCGRHQQEADCAVVQCVSGCFCRVPYLLRDPSDPASECVLPQQCPLPPPPLLSPPYITVFPHPSADVVQTATCSAAHNKTWTRCFSQKCARSCADLAPSAASSASAQCVPDDCVPGCECAAPALIRDKSAPVWECILPEDCHKDQRQKCEEPRKEYLTCGTSCPLGCDRLDQPLRTCSPCVSGCFCRNGFVFANASDWAHSDCVPISECPSPPSPTLFPPAPTTMVAFQLNADLSDAKCAANPLDQSGPVCADDAECGLERKCCPSSSSSSSPSSSSSSLRFPPAPRRCVCADPNALWSDCGSLCAEFCGQPGPRLCPGPCRPGCYCPPGFVKRTEEPGAECVPAEECGRAEGGGPIDHRPPSDPSPMATSLDLPTEFEGAKGEHCDVALASSTLYGKDGVRLGHVAVRPESVGRKGAKDHRIRLSGEFAADIVPKGAAALLLSLHQFSDTTIDGCAGVGEPLVLRVMEEEEEADGERRRDQFDAVSGTRTELRLPLRGDAEDFHGPVGMDMRVDWPDRIGPGTNPLIGHSVVLRAERGPEGAEPGTVTTLGCAVLGIAPSC